MTDIANLRDTLAKVTDKAVDRYYESSLEHTLEQINNVIANASITALRQWLEENQLVIVPRQLNEDIACAMECAWGTDDQWKAALSFAVKI
jgi:hypothetical protein